MIQCLLLEQGPTKEALLVTDWPFHPHYTHCHYRLLSKLSKFDSWFFFFRVFQKCLHSFIYLFIHLFIFWENKVYIDTRSFWKPRVRFLRIRLWFWQSQILSQEMHWISETPCSISFSAHFNQWSFLFDKKVAYIFLFVILFLWVLLVLPF